MLQKSEYIRFATNLNNTQKLLMLDALLEYKTIKTRTLDYYVTLLGVGKKMLIEYLKDLSEKGFIGSLDYSKDIIKFKVLDLDFSIFEEIKENAKFDFNEFMKYIEFKKEYYAKKGGKKKLVIGSEQIRKTANFLNALNDYDLATATLEMSITYAWIKLLPEKAKNYLMQKRAANLKTQNISISELIKAPNNTIIQNGVKYTAIYTTKGWEIEQCVAS
ncbi:MULTISPECIES: hypothetical protein [unclassified Campylobacter]|uniref:hypothetical protein n=1 Tax=unclassified Campylobacter TaxID=2593542 RepID=UPI001EFC1DB9|nr:hypothetical protein [Campylobacter sp. RM12651]MBZ7977140.1 hypothetical protein [Campylobacter sp. RM12637]ULO02942.1 hypothetical protein AVBRAN_0472 [Campylobacter sp. RM12651]